MTIEELRQKIGSKSYADAIISAVLDCPRTQYNSNDNVSSKDAVICQAIAKDWQIGRALAYERGKWRYLDLPIYITKMSSLLNTKSKPLQNLLS